MLHHERADSKEGGGEDISLKYNVYKDPEAKKKKKKKCAEADVANHRQGENFKLGEHHRRRGLLYGDKRD